MDAADKIIQRNRAIAVGQRHVGHSAQTAAAIDRERRTTGLRDACAAAQAEVGSGTRGANGDGAQADASVSRQAHGIA